MTPRRGIGGHQSSASVTCEWVTPPHILQHLGGAAAFDLDPCAMINAPWPCAREGYTLRENGLALPWQGDVYANPPYGRAMDPWMIRLAEHGNGIALIFARTETETFQDQCFAAATAGLFLRGRLHFHRPDGTRAKFNGGAPSVLLAYGDRHAERLLNCGLPGFFTEFKNGRMLK